ncbi:uncharacterized protein LOC143285048 [Babylonia areolata]|uniref:uncharacterized protein LOC143285048 n=1 Tax=Babylonia areolata TaxID=304850 RepID=UPI003FD5A72D
MWFETTPGTSVDMAAEKAKFVVVLAMDHSEFSEFAFKWYVKNLYNANHMVHIIHVLQSTKNTPEKRRESWDHSKKVGENYLSWAEQNGIKDVKFDSPSGESEWQEIIKYTERVGGQVIVMGSQALGPTRKTLTGRISDSVLKNSPIPVLVCRAKSV